MKALDVQISYMVNVEAVSKAGEIDVGPLECLFLTVPEV